MLDTWVSKSLVSLGCLIPAWLAIGFFWKNYGVRAEVTMLWYFGGLILGSAASVPFAGIFKAVDFIPTVPLLAIALLGGTFGLVANLLLFQAIPLAPNPALPVAIANTSSLFVFVFSAALALLLPRYFDPAALDLRSFAGLLAALAALYLITWR